MTTPKTLKTGCAAYFDTFAGLVPVKVLTVTAPEKPPVFDLGHGNARVSIKVTARVTKEHGPYKNGEVVESDSLHIVPRDAIIRHQFSSTIGVYDVVPDTQAPAAALMEAQTAE
jgi:hypothetical protein